MQTGCSEVCKKTIKDQHSPIWLEQARLDCTCKYNQVVYYKWIYEISYIWTAENDMKTSYDWSSQLCTQLKQLWNWSLKKFRPEWDSNPWPLLCNTGAVLYHQELATLWVPNILNPWLDSSVGRALYRNRRGPVQAWIFSGFNFTTA